MNKMVNGSQLTIVGHVDDSKISHKDEEVVTDICSRNSKRNSEKKLRSLLPGGRFVTIYEWPRGHFICTIISSRFSARSTAK